MSSWSRDRVSGVFYSGRPFNSEACLNTARQATAARTGWRSRSTRQTTIRGSARRLVAGGRRGRVERAEQVAGILTIPVVAAAPQSAVPAHQCHSTPE
jgi:hypothetical protein